MDRDNKKPKKLNTTGDIKVVTDNRFIIAKGLSALSLKARKLLYATIAQSRIRDSDFYEYETTPKELAALWEMAPDHIYLDARVFCRELMEQVIEVEDTKSHRWKLYHLMESASYDEDHVIRIKMHKEMVDLLLGLNKNFSQSPLWTFMRFKSSYSMALWHLFERELRFFSRQDSGGLKPGQVVEFDLSLEELRTVTGTEKKLLKANDFKKRVLDIAIREIRENLLINVTYKPIKKGRATHAYRFFASYITSVDPETLSLRTRMKGRRAELKRFATLRALSREEALELAAIEEELGQMTVEDFEPV